MEFVGVVLIGLALYMGGFFWLQRKMDRTYDGLE
jgi:hypothetical protein